MNAAVVAVLIVLLLHISLSTSLNFNFSDGFSNTMINCSGNATLSTAGIDLTGIAQNHLGFSSGRAVYYESLQLWENISGEVADFITHFTFTITNLSGSSGPADGLAFFLAPFPADQIPDKAYGLGLGLFNGFTPNVIAVEFDTFKNVLDFTPDHHIAIDVDSPLSANLVALHNVSLVTNIPGHATVSYNARKTTLSASLSYPGNQTLGGTSWNVSYVIDLRSYLPEQVAIGFSGGTGSKYELNVIKSWDFNSTELLILPITLPSRKKHRWILQVVINVVVIIGVCFILFLVRYCWKRKSKKIDGSQSQELLHIDGIFDQNDRAPKKFDYNELVTATREFSINEKLGEGGFGEVYKGVLVKMNDLQVAIKRISKGSMQGMKEYMAEVTIISRLRHRHLVQLIGYCHERGEFLLVYEYMPNKSLDAHLYNKHTMLGSQQRYKIALDIASALMYLHEGWEQGVVHRDIKPSNVMLDSHFNAKLGDFGMAKLVEHDRSMLATVIAGTRGYMAPEYIETGKAGKECDVYSFGILAMELACGRKPIDLLEPDVRVRLVDWVWDLYERQLCHEAIDKRLNKELDNGSMEHLMVVGLWCTHPDYRMRPTIRQAFCVLNFDAKLPPPPPRPDDKSSTRGTSSSFTGASCSEVLISSR